MIETKSRADLFNFFNENNKRVVDKAINLSRAEFYSSQPQYSFKDLNLCKKPIPPKIDINEIIDNKHVAMSVDWLRAFYLHKYGSAPRYRRSANYRKTKYWENLSGCLFLLQQAKVSPVRWILWVDQLAENRGQYGGPGGLYRIFSHKLALSQLDSCRRNTAEPGGQIVATPAYKEWCELKKQMDAALMRAYPQSQQEVRDIVKRYFPGNRWDIMVSKIKAEADMAREQFAADIAAHKWIW